MKALILPTTLYIVAYGVSFVLLLGMTLHVLDAAWKRLRGYEYPDSDRPFNLAEGLLALFLLSSSVVAPYYAFILFGYYPPFLASETRLTDVAASSEKVVVLADQVKRMRIVLANPEELSLRQLRDEMATSLEVFERLRDHAQEQDRIILLLEQKTQIERTKAEKAKATADEISSLTGKQLDAIRSVITADAKSESTRGFWLGVATSFPIGVLASLCAALLFRRINVRRSAEQAVARDG